MPFLILYIADITVGKINKRIKYLKFIIEFPILQKKIKDTTRNDINKLKVY